MESQILILTEKEYKKYQANLEEMSYRSPNLPSPIFVSTDYEEKVDSKAAEKLLQDETKKNYLSILKDLSLSLDPSKPKLKIQPININENENINKKYQDEVSKRLSQRTPTAKPKSKKRRILKSARVSQYATCNNSFERKTPSTHESIIERHKEKLIDLLNDDNLENLLANKEKKERCKRPLSLQIDDIKLAPEITDRTQTTLTRPSTARKPSKRILKKFMSQVLPYIPIDTLSTNPDTPMHAKESVKSKTVKKRKHVKQLSDSTLVLNIQKSLIGANRLAINNEKIQEKQIFDRILNEIKQEFKINQKEQSSNIIELMQIMFKVKPELGDIINPKEITKYKSLHERLYHLMKENPSKLYRIISDEETRLNTNRNRFETDDWTEEQEAAFRSMLRKTHSFNSLTKTRIFKEAEKNLPETRTTLDMEWKYDKHSPWANDFDYNEEQNLASSQTSKHAKKSSISNLRQECKGLTPEEYNLMKFKELQEKTGDFTLGFNALQKKAEKIDKINEVKEAITGYKIFSDWKHNKDELEKAKNKLASHIIEEGNAEVKKLNQARYSYLSAKVARQRAHKELQDKLIQRAEKMRKELRERQKTFQMLVLVYRKICRDLYRLDDKKPKRALLNSQYPLGSPLFKQSMIKLGYLPEAYNPSPAPPHEFDPASIKRIKTSIPKESLVHISLWNLHNQSSNDKKQDKNEMASKIKALIRGFVVRKRVAKIKKGAAVIKRSFVRYKTKKFILTALLVEHLSSGNKLLGELFTRYRETFIYNRVLKEVVSSPFIQKLLIERRKQKNLPTKSPQNLINCFAAGSSSKTPLCPKSDRSKRKHITFTMKSETEAYKINNKIKSPRFALQRKSTTNIPSSPIIKELPDSVQIYLKTLPIKKG
ncbi:unnamed protein product [Blepharisma stoltei]|uniref:Uncharacterized protein n=1 Tax=Blepharisma stoltei TaxID=1481888 RepID=A0AAU9K3H7_9CILI|nr:unnamed protein product [Blepharisma stoltei]